MGAQFIVVSSITYAYKGRDILESRGYKAFIERAPRHISECGCHYCLWVRGCSVEKALSLLKANHVKVLGTGSDYS